MTKSILASIAGLLTPEQLIVQVLQTLYILIQNIKKETSLYYIFSNNHINDIVTLSFDFEEDEVLGYYINLLKTISLRLTPKIVQLFFQVIFLIGFPTVTHTIVLWASWLASDQFQIHTVLSHSTIL